MKVSRDSWHYKLVSALVNDWPKRDLCGYMRQVCLALFVSALTLIPCVLIVVSLIAPIWLVETGASEVSQGCGLLIAMGVILWGAMLCVGVTQLLKWCLDKLSGHLRSKPKEVKRPSIATEWLKAKKQKICPIIEFED